MKPEQPDTMLDIYENRILERKEALLSHEEKYEGKTKGSIYLQTKQNIQGRIKAFQDKIASIGQEHNLIKIKGTYHHYQGEFKIEEPFQMFLTSISITDSEIVVKRMFGKELISFKCEEVALGELIITSK